jgi:hypothetical protein
MFFLSFCLPGVVVVLHPRDGHELEREGSGVYRGNVRLCWVEDGLALLIG